MTYYYKYETFILKIESLKRMVFYVIKLMFIYIETVYQLLFVPNPSLTISKTSKIKQVFN
jgi:hypothetical protein